MSVDHSWASRSAHLGNSMTCAAPAGNACVRDVAPQLQRSRRTGGTQSACKIPATKPDSSPARGELISCAASETCRRGAPRMGGFSDVQHSSGREKTHNMMLKMLKKDSVAGSRILLRSMMQTSQSASAVNKMSAFTYTHTYTNTQSRATTHQATKYRTQAVASHGTRGTSTIQRPC